MPVGEALKPGRFWDFYNRFKREKMNGLALVCCSELGVLLDRFLHPAIPQLLFQNDGGCCRDIRLDPSISDLLVLHHYPCAFSCKPPGISLLRAWKDLRARRRSLETGPSLALHFWMLDHQGGLMVFDPESGLLRSPIERVQVGAFEPWPEIPDSSRQGIPPGHPGSCLHSGLETPELCDEYKRK